MKIFHLLRNLMLPLNKIDLALKREGLIYEVGCGKGVISTYLAKQRLRTVVGIDKDLQKVRSKASKNLTFIQADATLFNYKPCNGAVLSDFLHHISYEKQHIVLEKISKAINKHGTLVIKEIDRDDTIRRLLSRFWDFIFYPEDQIYYMSKTELIRRLKKMGYEVTVSYEVGWFPGSTCLYICTKK